MILRDSLPGFDVVATPEAEEDGAPDGTITLRSPNSVGGTSEHTPVRKPSTPAILPATDGGRGRTSLTGGMTGG